MGDPGRRVPALDGLRGLAILLVVVAHVLPGLTAAGAAGVGVFFALSGYLITSILLGEQVRTGRIDLPGFYVRRARRLLPALVVFLVVTTGAAALLGRSWVASPEWAVASLLYVSNWPMAFGLESYGFLHTWSLGIEEQFYLLFPLLVIAFARKRKALLVVTLGICVASISLRVGLLAAGAGHDRVYYATDTTIGTILAGCALAVWSHGRPARHTDARLAVLGLTLAITALAFFPGDAAHAAVTVPAALLTVVLIARTAGSPDVGLLGTRMLVYLGSRSYALYLWHWPLVRIVLPELPGPRLISTAVVVAASLLLAELSTRYVEAPWLRRREPAAQPALASTTPSVRV